MEWKCSCPNHVKKIEDLCPMCQFEHDEWEMQALENKMEGMMEAMSDHFDMEVAMMMEDNEKEAG